MKPPFFILTKDSKETLPTCLPEGWNEAFLVVPNHGGECFTMLRFINGSTLPDDWRVYTRRTQFQGNGYRREICHGHTMEEALLTLLVNTNPPLASLLLNPPDDTEVIPLREEDRLQP